MGKQGLDHIKARTTCSNDRQHTCLSRTRESAAGLSQRPTAQPSKGGLSSELGRRCLSLSCQSTARVS